MQSQDSTRTGGGAALTTDYRLKPLRGESQPSTFPYRLVYLISRRAAKRESAVRLSQHPEKKSRKSLNAAVYTVLRTLETSPSELHTGDVFPWFAGLKRIQSNPVNIPGEDFLTWASLTHGDSPEFHSLEGCWCTRLPRRRYAGFRIGSQHSAGRSKPLILEH